MAMGVSSCTAHRCPLRHCSSSQSFWFSYSLGRSLSGPAWSSQRLPFLGSPRHGQEKCFSHRLGDKHSEISRYLLHSSHLTTKSIVMMHNMPNINDRGNCSSQLSFPKYAIIPKKFNDGGAEERSKKDFGSCYDETVIDSPYIYGADSVSKTPTLTWQDEAFRLKTHRAVHRLCKEIALGRTYVAEVIEQERVSRITRDGGANERVRSSVLEALPVEAFYGDAVSSQTVEPNNYNSGTKENPATYFSKPSEQFSSQSNRKAINPCGYPVFGPSDHFEVNSDSVPGRGKLSTDEVSTSDHQAVSSTKETSPLEHLTVKNTVLPDTLASIYEKVLIVDNISTARNVVRMLTTKYKNLVYACDTEVSKIDVKEETPVGHGEVICFSLYSGSQADYGSGKSCIWVDVLDGGKSLLMEFAPFFEDPSIKKVWHNYSFDCHVLQNYGIKVSGFHADTIHLARLWDSSRRINGGYSLEALTSNANVMCGTNSSSNSCLTVGKESMKSVFGKKKLKKDGSEGKLVTLAPVEELQRGERIPWICYSAKDAMKTLELFESMKAKLESKKWFLDGVPRGSMYGFYEEYWRPFGALLVKMESEGMLVDRTYLAKMEKVAVAEKQVAADRFRKWASKYCPDAKYMNVGSDSQIRQLFFGGKQNRKDHNESLPDSKSFKVPNTGNVIEEGKKTPSKYLSITLSKLEVEMPTDMYTPSGWPSVSGDALKAFAGKVPTEHIIYMDDEYELQSENTQDVMPAVTSMKQKNGEVDVSPDGIDTSNYGTAYAAFGGGKAGREACHAIAALCEICSIDSMLSNFILPLQGDHISGSNGRIHCSLNINTETGRLSARRPNLQNQPALEKDRYKIRQAFIAEPGNSLIVADYGQLELRILAHLAKCQSMLDAFKAGGDFHSRTAMNMYSHVREAVDENRVLLEWHPKPGEERPPVPLLKDAFASERRKAKMLNFSIAYGKTPVGLSRDWKVSVKEAKETVKLWYKERQEVLRWQEKRKIEAKEKQCVHTLLGRARRFPSMTNASNAQKGHIERAAINTPVQGSAADVAMCAMLEIERNSRLKALGWRLLLQVHDEVILEGPTESAEIAKAIVVECMSKPFYGTNFLSVDLAVDAKFAESWYAAK